MTLMAHAGHWLVNVLYLAPVITFGGWMTFTTIRDRRAAQNAPPRGREPPEAKRNNQAPNKRAPR